MPSKSDMAQLAKAVGGELGKKPGQQRLSAEFMRDIGAGLADTGGAVQVIGGIFAEARRQRPSAVTLNGYAFMLTAALDALRLGANGGRASARGDIAKAQAMVGQEVAKGVPSPDVLMLVARAFAQAELDPGRALQDATMAMMDAGPPPDDAEGGRGSLAGQLEHIAQALGNDPFTIYDEMSSSAAAIPPEQRSEIAAAFLASGNPAVREAALGFAFAREPVTSTAALAAWAHVPPGQPVSSRMVERLVRMRPWVSPGRQIAVDAAVRALRPRAAAPVKAPRPDVVRVLASMCDGSGAQTMFALVKQDRRFALASVLLKTNGGVADAWVHGDMRKPEANGMVEHIINESDGVEVSIGLFERRLADVLAINVAQDTPPPFGLLHVVETLGLGPVHPETVAPASLAVTLLADQPETKKGAAAVKSALRASDDWPFLYPTVKSWFEAGEAVERLLKPLKTREARLAAVMTQLLPARRGFWAERCAWTAAILKEPSKRNRAPWIDFALVAGEWAGERPLDAIPLARRIAETTVEAFAHR